MQTTFYLPVAEFLKYEEKKTVSKLAVFRRKTIFVRNKNLTGINASARHKWI
jgi:hypothetical protein